MDTRAGAAVIWIKPNTVFARRFNDVVEDTPRNQAYIWAATYGTTGMCNMPRSVARMFCHPGLVLQALLAAGDLA